MILRFRSAIYCQFISQQLVTILTGNCKVVREFDWIEEVVSDLSQVNELIILTEINKWSFAICVWGRRLHDFMKYLERNGRIWWLSSNEALKKRGQLAWKPMWIASKDNELTTQHCPYTPIYLCLSFSNSFLISTSMSLVLFISLSKYYSKIQFHTAARLAFSC